MTEKRLYGVFVILLTLGFLAYGALTIVWAYECGQKGGAYIIPQNSFPVCVQGVK